MTLSGLAAVSCQQEPRGKKRYGPVRDAREADEERHGGILGEHRDEVGLFARQSLQVRQRQRRD